MGQLNLGNGANFIGGSGGYLSDAPKGNILQIVTSHGKTNFSSTSSSYVETPVNCTITPRSSTSQILVRQCVSSWEGNGAYGHRQVRATGGYTNNDCGTYGDYYSYGSAAYGTRIHEVLVTNHNTTSAITFTCWGKGGNSNTWYWPNNYNNTTMTHKYIMVCTEIAT